MVGSDSILTTPVCFKDVASVFDHKLSDIFAISKQLSSSWTIDEAIANCPDFAKHCKSFPNELKIMRKMHGIVRQLSTHAGGVIIAKDVASQIPVRTADGNREILIAGFDKDVLHDLGYTKFDLLGLSTLSVIEYAVASINKEFQMKFNLDNIPLDDEEVYQMLCDGDVHGVFQLSSQKHMVVQQQPRTFADLIAINALIRPGTAGFDEYCARRNGKSYTILPERIPYMQDTMGLMLYQEQYLLDCKVFAGWEIAFSDSKVRKNKDIRNDTELKAKFLMDSVARGFNIDDMKMVWSEIEDSVDNGYGFNKSHATSYAVTSYKTAYLKHYYPEHFYASILTFQCKNTDELAEVTLQLKQKKIELFAPDINLSSDKFVAKNRNIYYKLSAVKNVGESAYVNIIGGRPYNSLLDFINRTEKKYVRSNVIESLIKSGCFDFENKNRTLLLNKMSDKEKYLEDWNDETKMQYEKESIGFYLTSNPLDKYYFESLSSFQDNTNALIAGELTEITEKKDKNQNTMAFLNIITQYGVVRGILFSSKWTKSLKEALILDRYYIFEGLRSGDAILINKIKKL